MIKQKKFVKAKEIEQTISIPKSLMDEIEALEGNPTEEEEAKEEQREINSHVAGILGDEIAEIASALE